MQNSMSIHPPRNTSEVRRALLGWAAVHLREFPWRDRGTCVYQVLIAEVLLKRTTARAAARVFAGFITRFPDLESIEKASIEDLEGALAPVGLYRQRATGLKQMAQYLRRERGGQIPDNLPDLLKVPHLGPYSAGAVLSFGYGRPAAIVDSNVQRVLGRLYQCQLGESPTLSATQALADVLLDPEAHQVFNWALLDLGAVVCRYDVPRCRACPLSSVCEYFKRNSVCESDQPGGATV